MISISNKKVSILLSIVSIEQALVSFAANCSGTGEAARDVRVHERSEPVRGLARKMRERLQNTPAQPLQVSVCFEERGL